MHCFWGQYKRNAIALLPDNVLATFLQICVSIGLLKQSQIRENLCEWWQHTITRVWLHFVQNANHVTRSCDQNSDHVIKIKSHDQWIVAKWPLPWKGKKCWRVLMTLVVSCQPVCSVNMNCVREYLASSPPRHSTLVHGKIYFSLGIPYHLYFSQTLICQFDNWHFYFLMCTSTGQSTTTGQSINYLSDRSLFMTGFGGSGVKCRARIYVKNLLFQRKSPRGGGTPHINRQGGQDFKKKNYP